MLQLLSLLASTGAGDQAADGGLRLAALGSALPFYTQAAKVECKGLKPVELGGLNPSRKNCRRHRHKLSIASLMPAMDCERATLIVVAMLRKCNIAVWAG